MEWLFEPGVRTRRGGSAAAYAFKPTLDVFVREVLQNAKDQKRPDSPLTRVHFGLKILKKRSLKTFLDALRWRELEPHIQAASAIPHAVFLRRALDNLEAVKELVLLRIDDSGTGGLVGGDLEPDKPFTSLCVDELFSTKESAGTGGSYGLGKSVLWRFSSFSTVLFTSHLEPDAYKSKELNRTDRGLRMFGRTQLPWHSIDDEAFDGPCWFGKRGKHDGRDVAWSVWDPQSSAVAAKLQADREAVPGTSILIVGFTPPAEEALSAEQLAKRICQAAAKHFWPVLRGTQPQLEVTADVIDAETGKTLVTDRASITEDVKPFVQCLDAFRDGETTKEIEEEEDIAAADIPLKIPGTVDGEPPVEATVTLCVRLASKAKGLVNHVAYTRGFGMVVKYWNLEGISLSAQPFVATLICGTLRGNTDEDKAIEKFLRYAEPPEHDTWASNQRLQARYKKGSATLLDNLDRQVKAIIKQLVSQAAGEGEKGPQLLSRMFPIGPSGPEKRKHPFAVGKRTAVLGSDGAWLFSGEVKRVSGKGAWQARVALRFRTDDGAEGAVVKDLTKVKPAPERYTVTEGVAIIEMPKTAGTLAFTGRSDPKLHPVDSKRAAVTLEVLAGEINDLPEEDEVEAQ